MSTPLRTFFQNLAILQEFQKEEEDAVAAIDTTTTSSNENEALPKMPVIICDNAHSPTTTLLRKQRRRRQLQQLKEQRRRQQTRPIYNRSLSVNSFATSPSPSSQRKYKSLKPCLLLQTSDEEEDEEETTGTPTTPISLLQRRKKVLAAFFNDSHILSPSVDSAVASNSNSDHSRGQEPLQEPTADALITPTANDTKDRKMIMARRTSPISVMDAPFLNLYSPTALPGGAADDAVEDGITPKTSNRQRRPGAPLFTRGDSMSSLMEAKPPFLSPIVSSRSSSSDKNINNNRTRRTNSSSQKNKKKKNGSTTGTRKTKKMMDGSTTSTTTSMSPRSARWSLDGSTTTTPTCMSPRSARWSLVRQESDSVLIRPSRQPSIHLEEDCY